ncbi:MAG: glycosyltransferase [Candidatus Dojkabacteria bacterium]
METAIIIVNYKTPWYLNKCLESVFENTSDFHIFIALNSNDEASLKVVNKFKKKYPNEITVIDNKKNLGFVGGVNSAYSQAIKYERVCLLNSDTIVTPEWLMELNKVLDENDDVVQVSPDSNSFYVDKSLWRFSKLLPPFLSRLSYLQIYTNSLPVSTNYDDRFKEIKFYEYNEFYKFCAGFCNVFKSKYFKNLGYFCDPNIVHGYWDDFDLSMYLRKFGTIGWTNSSYVFHYVNISFNKISEEKKGMKEELNLLNGLYVMDKWSKEVLEGIKEMGPEELEARHDSYVVNMALKYLERVKEGAKFTEYIQTIPAKSIGEKFLG